MQILYQFSSRPSQLFKEPSLNPFIDLLESKGVSPLTEMLKAVGGWPVLEGDNWESTSWTWETAIASLRKRGLVTDYFLKVGVVPDLKEPTRWILQVRFNIFTFIIH